jgi:hypothetical protein
LLLVSLAISNNVSVGKGANPNLSAVSSDKLDQSAKNAELIQENNLSDQNQSAGTPNNGGRFSEKSWPPLAPVTLPSSNRGPSVAPTREFTLGGFGEQSAIYTASIGNLWVCHVRVALHSCFKNYP